MGNFIAAASVRNSVADQQSPGLTSPWIRRRR